MAHIISRPFENSRHEHGNVIRSSRFVSEQGLTKQVVCPVGRSRFGAAAQILKTRSNMESLPRTPSDAEYFSAFAAAIRASIFAILDRERQNCKTPENSERTIDD